MLREDTIWNLEEKKNFKTKVMEQKIIDNVYVVKKQSIKWMPHWSYSQWAKWGQ